MSKVSRDKKKQKDAGKIKQKLPHNTKTEGLGPNTDRQ